MTVAACPGVSQELRETPGHFLDDLLSGIERKTSWLMTESA
jgi:hypothetical protein